MRQARRRWHFGHAHNYQLFDTLGLGWRSKGLLVIPSSRSSFKHAVCSFGHLSPQESSVGSWELLSSSFNIHNYWEWKAEVLFMFCWSHSWISFLPHWNSPKATDIRKYKQQYTTHQKDKKKSTFYIFYSGTKPLFQSCFLLTFVYIIIVFTIS